MGDQAATPPRRKPRRPGLILWLSLFLAPIAGMLLLLSHVGRAWIDRGAVAPVGAAILPGLTIEATPASRDHFVITSIQSDSAANHRGIAVGDRVVAIDGARIFSLDQARSSLQKSRADAVALRVEHGREYRDIRLVRARPRREGERHGSQVAGHRR
jgi:membrane-associated protease RseP (regulator of RpoE activity)